MEPGAKHLQLTADVAARVALETTADGLLVVDRQGRIVMHNRRFVDLWGLPDELLAHGENDKALAFAEHQLVDPSAFRSRVREMYAQDLLESFDVLRLRDGRVFERHSRPCIVDGVSLGRVLSFRDVTSLMRAEESRFRSVIENVRDAVITADGNGDILGWNKGARDTFGYEEAEVVGQPLTLIVPERYRASHLEAFVRAVRAGAGTITGRTMDLWGLRKRRYRVPVRDLGQRVAGRGWRPLQRLPSRHHRTTPGRQRHADALACPREHEGGGRRRGRGGDHPVRERGPRENVRLRARRAPRAAHRYPRGGLTR
jgi:PAS domain S-box-containing protein